MAGLYIHIPKCASKCAYCDFFSVAGVDNARLVEALKREITARRNFFRAPPAATANDFSGLDTIYFGGGTPSQLTPEQLQELLRHALDVFGGRARELTLEANPEDLTDEYLTKLAATAFNRLSIGVQSFDDGLLRLMNRRHTAARARQAVRQAQAAGFDNISIDLIWGIPGMTAGQLRRTLESALELGVQHISAYHLTIEPGTAFGRSKMNPIAESESERQYEILRLMLSDGGFEQYEISNWALPARRAVHNSAYWRGAAYLGIGPGAHSFDGSRTRSWVAPDVEKYLSHFAAGAGDACDFGGVAGGKNGDKNGGGIYGGEVLSDVDLRNERLMVGLRTVEGVEASDETRRLAAKFLREGLLVERPSTSSGQRSDGDGSLDVNDSGGRRIAIPPEKFLLADYIISSLFE